MHPCNEQITRIRFGDSSRAASPPLHLLNQFPQRHPPTSAFDNIIGKIFSKSLIGSLASKDAVQNGVRDCILTHNETRAKELNPYTRSHWRDVQRSGCVCIDVKIAIPNVFWEALIDDIYVGHPGT